MSKRILTGIIMCVVITFKMLAQYQVNCISTDRENMTFRVVGYGKNLKEASHDAETGVIKTLIFYGVPNSPQSVAMINRPQRQVESEYSSFFDNFYKRDYQNLINKSIIVRKFGKDENKQKNIVLDVTVNVRALRQELERNGVIRKFGL